MQGGLGEVGLRERGLNSEGCLLGFLRLVEDKGGGRGWIRVRSQRPGLCLPHKERSFRWKVKPVNRAVKEQCPPRLPSLWLGA